jgi:hypothetical protein
MANFCSLLELVSFKGDLCKTHFGSSSIINKDEIELNRLKPKDNVETNINIENESCFKCKDFQGFFNGTTLGWVCPSVHNYLH